MAAGRGQQRPVRHGGSEESEETRDIDGAAHVRKNAIILGMARSGTSLTASIFGRTGYFAGDELVPANHQNPTGYWEARSLLRHNASILMSTGFERDNSWMYAPMTEAQIAALAQVRLGDEQRGFVAQFERHAPWLWKDPRLCYTLRCWWPLLNHDTTAALLVERDREAIFRSFVRVGWRELTADDRAATYARIDAHMASARQTLQDLAIPSVTIRYEDYRERPADVIARINDCFGVHLSADDIGYEDDFNHDSLVGSIGTRIDQMATLLPAPLRRFVKRLTPRTVLRKMYPERFR